MLTTLLGLAALAAHTTALPLPAPTGNALHQNDGNALPINKEESSDSTRALVGPRVNDLRQPHVANDASERGGISPDTEHRIALDEMAALAWDSESEKGVGSSRGTMDDNEAAAREVDLKKIQDTWLDGKVNTFVSPNSNQALGSPSTNGKGKAKAQQEKQHSPPYPTRRTPKEQRGRAGSLLRFTSQKPPFHTSEVGSLASRQPAALSVGIFKPDYPFTPSGRRRLREKDMRTQHRGHGYGKDVRAEKVPYEAVYTVSDDVAHGNVFKKGWTKWMLDDDSRLTVPDDYRHPRKESAVMIAKNLLGKKWYRWKPGEGYVMSRYKDYSIYKNGPGIAMGQLLPPRERPHTAHLPLIPNDSKRDFVWLIMLWIVGLSVFAIVLEVRAHIRSLRKGKRRSTNAVPSIRIFNDETSPVRTSSVEPVSIGLRTRQRTQARNLRDLCKAALFPGVGQMGGGVSLTDASSIAMNNVRWMTSSNGGANARGKDDEDLLPMSNSHHDDDGSDVLHGTAIRRSRSSTPYAGHGQEDEEGGPHNMISVSSSSTSNDSVTSNGYGHINNDRGTTSHGNGYALPYLAKSS